MGDRVLETHKELIGEVDKVLLVEDEVINMGLLVLFLIYIYKELFCSNYLCLRVVPYPSTRAREVGQDAAAEPTKHSAPKVGIIIKSLRTVVDVVFGPS